MGDKFSVYAGAPMAAALDALGSHYAENRSGRLNTVCERYLAMVADELARLDFSRAEWCAILDANNGVDLGLGIGTGGAIMIWANVHDSHGLGEKWSVDQAALVRRLQALPRSSLYAICEVADRFWSRAETPTDTALAAAARIYEECATELRAALKEAQS
jgi:hypothetical protein